MHLRCGSMAQAPVQVVQWRKAPVQSLRLVQGEFQGTGAGFTLRKFVNSLMINVCKGTATRLLDDSITRSLRHRRHLICEICGKKDCSEKNNLRVIHGSFAGIHVKNIYSRGLAQVSLCAIREIRVIRCSKKRFTEKVMDCLITMSTFAVANHQAYGKA